MRYVWLVTRLSHLNISFLRNIVWLAHDYFPKKYSILSQLVGLGLGSVLLLKVSCSILSGANLDGLI
jgi:hypothetical protein